MYPVIPNDPPAKFVVYEKTGGGYDDHINRATIAIQSYDESIFKCASLNDEVKKHMINMVELPEISSVKLNSDYNFTDTTRKRNRYQCVFDIYYY
ncbi:MAG: hypothetical protein MJZ37_07925 [Bacilli bacterium]|nr:hypothetical protein [Bacilli bacterium]